VKTVFLLPSHDHIKPVVQPASLISLSNNVCAPFKLQISESELLSTSAVALHSMQRQDRRQHIINNKKVNGKVQQTVVAIKTNKQTNPQFPFEIAILENYINDNNIQVELLQWVKLNSVINRLHLQCAGLSELLRMQKHLGIFVPPDSIEQLAKTILEDKPTDEQYKICNVSAEVVDCINATKTRLSQLKSGVVQTPRRGSQALDKSAPSSSNKRHKSQLQTTQCTPPPLGKPPLHSTSKVATRRSMRSPSLAIHVQPSTPVSSKSHSDFASAASPRSASSIDNPSSSSQACQPKKSLGITCRDVDDALSAPGVEVTHEQWKTWKYMQSKSHTKELICVTKNDCLAWNVKTDALAYANNARTIMKLSSNFATKLRNELIENRSREVDEWKKRHDK
jgi:hypothetical protein